MAVSGHVRAHVCRCKPDWRAARKYNDNRSRRRGGSQLIFQFSHRAKIGQNDHSKPYIESTTVLSDIVLALSQKEDLLLSTYSHVLSYTGL